MVLCFSGASGAAPTLIPLLLLTRASRNYAVAGQLNMESLMHERLAKIAKISEQELNLAEAALLIAVEEYPGLDVEAYLRQIDELATGVQQRLPAQAGLEDTLITLNQFLFLEQGFSGGIRQRAARTPAHRGRQEGHTGASVTQPQGRVPAPRTVRQGARRGWPDSADPARPAR